MEKEASQTQDVSQGYANVTHRKRRTTTIYQIINSDLNCSRVSHLHISTTDRSDTMERSFSPGAVDTCSSRLPHEGDKHREKYFQTKHHFLEFGGSLIRQNLTEQIPVHCGIMSLPRS